MREIRFRGMTTNLVENEFVYGYYQKLIGYGEYDLGNIYHFIVNENDESNYVDEKTLGQFIGLKDKNGVEIYEGDITRHIKHETEGVWRFSEHFACFIMEEFDVNESHRFYFKIDEPSLEIIGNIHEVQK